MVYNAEEIYQIGIEIEKNGKAFYQAATEKVDDSDAKKLLSDLSKWEDNHISIFEKLQASLPEDATSAGSFDPDEESVRYLKAVADSHIFLQGKDAGELIETCKNVIEILKMALQFEKDSVVLYTSMRDMVPEHLGKDTVNRLANEEVTHVAFIQKQLSILE